MIKNACVVAFIGIAAILFTLPTLIEWTIAAAHQLGAR